MVSCMWTRQARVLACLCLVVAGCSQYHDPDVPEPIRPFAEPEAGSEYLLYRPSSYDREHAWPLVVVCHSSSPDSPNRQIREWTEMAEDRGFLVVAPTLSGVRSLGAPRTKKQLVLQQEDEACILSAIRHVRAGHNVSEDRIFIHGWSGGAYAALYTGLRNPDLFRAVSVGQPRFNEDFVASLTDAVDPHQPVFVHASVTDALTGKHASRCMAWLRSARASLTHSASGAVRRTDVTQTLRFYTDILRHSLWLHIRAYALSTTDPYEIQFKFRASHAPSRVLWSFGDDRESASPEPVHKYAGPGTYAIRLVVEGPDGREYQRLARLILPEGRLVRGWGRQPTDENTR